jgi:hypothetical protein
MITWNARSPTKITIPKYIKKVNLFLDFSRRSYMDKHPSSPQIAGSLSKDIGFQQTEQCLCGSVFTLVLD